MNELEAKESDISLQKEHVRRRYRARSMGDVTVIPAVEALDIYDDPSRKRVAVYARVSTDSVNQTSSYELQKNYYEGMIKKHDNWELVDIYADEGISGTSLRHRNEFIRMIKDCQKGSIDLIITKNVSRFARNTVDCIQYSRDLKELNPQVGILFETEGIYTLNENSEMQLSFLATLAQEESHSKSQSMNRSYRMRFERGIYMTPVLIGYDHDEEGNLIINPEEAKTVRLIFLLYMSGMGCAAIADILTEFGRNTKKGNMRWNGASIYGILKNERYCGDLLAQKTYTPNFLTHKVKKVVNNERTQYYEKDHHEAIISREDYILVRKMMDQSKYGFRKAVPELYVINKGVLKGFVQINPKWMGFSDRDYVNACHSVLDDADYLNPIITIRRIKGDYDLRKYQVTRSQFLPTTAKISVNISYNRIRFSSRAVYAMDGKSRMELLYHPLYSLLVVRPAKQGDKHSVIWSTYDGIKHRPNHIKGNAFCPILYKLNDWNKELKYTLTGYVKEQAGEKVLLFYADEPEIRVRQNEVEHIAFEADWEQGFGDYYYTYLAKTESVFTPGMNWNTDSVGVLANTPEYELKKEKDLKEEINRLSRELGGREIYS